MAWTRPKVLEATLVGGMIGFSISWFLWWLDVVVSFSIPWYQPGFLVFPGTSGSIPVHLQIKTGFWGYAIGSPGDAEFATWVQLFLTEGEAGWLALGNLLVLVALCALLVGVAGPRLRMDLLTKARRELVLTGAILLLLGLLVHTLGFLHAFEWELSASDLSPGIWLAWLGALTGSTAAMAWWFDSRNTTALTEGDADPESAVELI